MEEEAKNLRTQPSHSTISKMVNKGLKNVVNRRYKILKHTLQPITKSKLKKLHQLSMNICKLYVKLQGKVHPANLN